MAKRSRKKRKNKNKTRRKYEEQSVVSKAFCLLTQSFQNNSIMKDTSFKS